MTEYKNKILVTIDKEELDQFQRNLNALKEREEFRSRIKSIHYKEINLEQAFFNLNQDK